VVVNDSKPLNLWLFIQGNAAIPMRAFGLGCVLSPEDHVVTVLLAFAVKTIAEIPGIEGARVKVLTGLLKPEKRVALRIEHVSTLARLGMLDSCYIARVGRFEDIVRVATRLSFRISP